MRLLARLLPRLTHGRLTIETDAGDSIILDGGQPGPQARITIHRKRCLWRMLAGGDVAFAEAYMAGDWSSPDLIALVALGLANDHAIASAGTSLANVARKIRHALNGNTLRGSRRNIAAHYDLGNDFYAHWLDAGMTYSSALFEHPGQTLEAAQDVKLDLICSLLALGGRESVLEIGCGWGGVAERLIERHACKVTALTLSERQLAFTRDRLRAWPARADFRLQDYRAVTGRYDRIVSIEMLEAVGEAYWPTYFAKVAQCLREDGIAVVQAITIADDRFEAYRSNPDFIQRYIFPGGMLPTASAIAREANAAGLVVESQNFFGASYALTLAHWQRRFQRAWPDIARIGFDARFKRTWEYYLAYCQAGFEAGRVDVGLFKLRRVA